MTTTNEGLGLLQQCIIAVLTSLAIVTVLAGIRHATNAPSEMMPAHSTAMVPSSRPP